MPFLWQSLLATGVSVDHVQPSTAGLQLSSWHRLPPPTYQLICCRSPKSAYGGNTVDLTVSWPLSKCATNSDSTIMWLFRCCTSCLEQPAGGGALVHITASVPVRDVQALLVTLREWQSFPNCRKPCSFMILPHTKRHSFIIIIIFNFIASSLSIYLIQPTEMTGATS